MKLKFKTQAYQTAAVQAVVDCFKGQVPHHGGIRYRLDPGSQKAAPASPQAVPTDTNAAACSGRKHGRQVHCARGAGPTGSLAGLFVRQRFSSAKRFR